MDQSSIIAICSLSLASAFIVIVGYIKYKFYRVRKYFIPLNYELLKIDSNLNKIEQRLEIAKQGLDRIDEIFEIINRRSIQLEKYVLWIKFEHGHVPSDDQKEN